MNYLFYIFLFLLGSIIGSFLNVVICRLKTTENGSRGIYREPFSVKWSRFVDNRSHCPKCGRVLAWYDLIPIVSFFVLRARCRHCGEKISWQYPLVEMATGILFVAVYQLVSLSVSQFNPFLSLPLIRGGVGWGGFFTLGYLLYATCSLIVIFVYDLRHYIIPDVVLFPAIGITVIYRLFVAFDSATLRLGNNIAQAFPINLFPELVEGFRIFLPYLLAALGAATFFLAIILITRGRGMGIGDAKLAILMGLMLGWPNILTALFIAFFSGAVVGLALIAAGKKTMKSQIPFGPFLISGTLVALFLGRFFLDWYGAFYF